MMHTKEPWKVSYECEWVVEHDRYSSYTWAGIDARGETVALAVSHRSSDLMEANARRIVACVNALAGIETDRIERLAESKAGRMAFASSMDLWLSYCDKKAELETAIEQRDELLEACKTFLEWVLREETGFCKAGRDRSTPEGEAAWREWYDENTRLCSLAQEQARAAIAREQGEAK